MNKFAIIGIPETRVSEPLSPHFGEMQEKKAYVIQEGCLTTFDLDSAAGINALLNMSVSESLGEAEKLEIVEETIDNMISDVYRKIVYALNRGDYSGVAWHGNEGDALKGIKKQVTEKKLRLTQEVQAVSCGGPVNESFDQQAVRQCSDS